MNLILGSLKHICLFLSSVWFLDEFTSVGFLYSHDHWRSQHQMTARIKFHMKGRARKIYTTMKARSKCEQAMIAA